MTTTINASTSAGLISSADTSGILQLQTANIAALTINASQNVGIGTASPSQKLTISGTAATNMTSIGLVGSTTGYQRILMNNTSGGAQFGIEGSTASTICVGSAAYATVMGSYQNYPTQVITNNNVVATFDPAGNLGLGVTPSAWVSTAKVFEVGSTGSFSNSGANDTAISDNRYYNGTNNIYKTTNPATIYSLASGQHRWFTAPSGTAGNAITFTQAMSLLANGSLCVGTTTQLNGGSLNIYGAANSSPLANFYSNTSGDVGNAILNLGKVDNNTTTSQVFLRCGITSTGAGAGQINMNGANSLAFGTFSDARLKENVVNLPSQLENILALRPVEFDYIQSEGGGHQIGFIAQEMQQIYPDAVGEREDGMLTVSGWSKTEARLIKAIQELNEKFEEYKATHP